MTTTIKEAIKGIENLVIVKNEGGILAIRNNFDSLSFGIAVAQLIKCC